MIPVCVESPQPVVSTVLGVDHVQHALDEVSLLCVQNIGKIGPSLVTAFFRCQECLVVARALVLGQIEVECKYDFRSKVSNLVLVKSCLTG